MRLEARRGAFRQTAGQLMRFGLATGFSAIVSLGLPVTLHELLHVEQKVAVAISQASVLLVNFVTLRIFVFRSSGSVRQDVFGYAASALVFRALEYLLFLILFELAGLFYVTALVITLCLSTLIKFVWYRSLFGGQRTAPIV
jgi:putative flippase GtrA